MTQGAGNWRAAGPLPFRPGAIGWLRVAVKGTMIGLVTYGCLILLLLLRLVERPLFGVRRPLTPWITQFVCRGALRLIGLRCRVQGRPMQGEGAIVANHSSWLDIFVLNACDRVYFVSKAEVAGWAGIGWLARATGTVFIARKGSEAKVQARLFEARLHAGHRLLFFPEGTSTDAIRIVPFKSTLFAAFFAAGLNDRLQVQPVSVAYIAPEGADPRFYGWWGDLVFAPHLMRMLATGRHGAVEVMFHDPVRVADFADRKALAAHCERVIRQGHAAAFARAGRSSVQVG